MDDDNGIAVDGSNSFNHRSTLPPQSEVVSVPHISDHDVVRPEFTTHTATLLIHHCEMSRDRSDSRVCEHDRDILSPRSGDSSVDVVGERGGHNPAAADVVDDGTDRGDNVIQGVRARSPSTKCRLNRPHPWINGWYVPNHHSTVVALVEITVRGGHLRILSNDRDSLELAEGEAAWTRFVIL